LGAALLTRAALVVVFAAGCLAGPWAARAAEDPLATPRFITVGAGAIPRDVVPAIAQDREGYLWVATGDGLVRYDGYRFRAVQWNRPDPASRNLGWVQAMLATPDGRVWIGSESEGLAVYDPATDAIENHRPTAGPAPTVLALAQTADGSIWVGTLGGGLLRFDPKKNAFETLRAADRDLGLPDDRVQVLRVDRSGALWVGTWRGLVRRAAGATRFERVRTADVTGPPADAPTLVVNALFEASDGRMWIGTQSGDVWISDATGSRAVKVEPALGATGPAGAVTSIVETPAGEIWVGRTDGIDVVERAGGRLIQRVRPEARVRNGLNGSHVTALLVDRAGSVWVAGFGIGLQRHPAGLRAIRMRGRDIDDAGALNSADVRSLMQRRDGTVWLAPHAGGIVEVDRSLQVRRRFAAAASGDPPFSVLTMCEDRDGQVWVGGHDTIRRLGADGQVLRTLQHPGGDTNHLVLGPDGTLWVATVAGLYRLRPGASAVEPVGVGASPTPVGQVWMNALDADGTLWAATATGLYRLPKGAEALQAVVAEPGHGLGNPIVLSLLFDRQGTLWLDTAVTGLHRLSGWSEGRARFERITARHGVFNRPFGVNLLQDRRGRLWTHMYVYDPARDALHELTESDGVMLGTGWFRSYAALDDGRMLFGGAHGVLVVDPERFDTPRYAPPLVVSVLRINGSPRPYPRDGRDIELQPGDRDVAVEFAALEFNETARQRYAFKLEGVDSDWIEGGTELRTASYGNLAPGRYVLRARVANGDGVWSPQELALPLRVHAAWWQQAWFAAALCLLAVLAFVGALRWRTQRLNRQRLALEQAVELRTAELKQARDELEAKVLERTRDLFEAVHAAEAASRAKTTFLQSISHEMRTPLNAVLGLTHLQLQESPPEPQHGRLLKVKSAANHLLGVINDVLDFAMIEAGKTEVRQERFLVPALLDALRDLLDHAATEKGLSLSFHCDAPLADRPLQGDRQRILGILLNLGGNAVKFTDRGTVRISARVEASDGDTVTLRFEVEDSGIGIPAEAQGRLFRAFERVDDPATRFRGGTGLGLAISRRWAELMGGQVGVSSAPGQGSRFWLSIPLAWAKAESPSSVAPPAATERFHGERVLLVEDDPVNRLVAAAMLEAMGLAVDQAENGAEAIRRVSESKYALILMDVQMPDVDGLEATRIIRGLPGCAGVPIIGLTALSFDDDRQRCLDAGMNDHLGKPVVPELLFATIRRFLPEAR
jgi:signal transduction histidine kinase/ligand-binding sensor domain-containing protein/CheY-like chemotaxis protein